MDGWVYLADGVRHYRRRGKTLCGKKAGDNAEADKEFDYPQFWDCATCARAWIERPELAGMRDETERRAE